MIDGFVYEFFNTANGKSYVGVTEKGLSRIMDHFRDARYGSLMLLQQDIRRYGPKAFVVRVHCGRYRDRNELHLHERSMIASRGALAPQGYNITKGGSGPDYGPAFSAMLKSRWKDPVLRLKVSKADKLKWQEPEYRRKHGAASARAWKSPAYRRKMRAIAKHRREDPDYRRRVSTTQSTSIKLKWENQNYRRNVCASLELMWKDPNYRRKRRASIKRRQDYLEAQLRLYRNEQFLRERKQLAMASAA